SVRARPLLVTFVCIVLRFAPQRLIIASTPATQQLPGSQKLPRSCRSGLKSRNSQTRNISLHHLIEDGNNVSVGIGFDEPGAEWLEIRDALKVIRIVSAHFKDADAVAFPP